MKGKRWRGEGRGEETGLWEQEWDKREAEGGREGEMERGIEGETERGGEGEGTYWKKSRRRMKSSVKDCLLDVT